MGRGDQRRKGKRGRGCASQRPQPTRVLSGNGESTSPRDQRADGNLYRDRISGTARDGGVFRAETRNGIDLYGDAGFFRRRAEQMAGTRRKTKGLLSRYAWWFGGCEILFHSRML